MIMHAMALIFVLITGSPEEPKEQENSTLTPWVSGEPLRGKVVTINDQGIQFKADNQDIPLTVGWFDVRELNPPNSEYTKYRQVADDAWRAHARIMRGDYFGAEQIYAQLEQRYLWKVGPQSADVSMGLLRCRLDRDSRVEAVMPFMSWLGTSALIASGAVQVLPGFDGQHNLLVALPPVFGPDDRGQGLGSIPESDRITDRQRVLFGLYQLALDKPSHRTLQAREVIEDLDGITRGRDNRDQGIKLIEDMVIAQAHPNSQSRTAARLALDRRIRTDKGTWIELWARLAIGVSLLGEEDTESNERGVIELIHIIVRLDQVNGSLAVLASQIANEYLVRTDRTQWGAELMFEARTAWTNGQSGVLAKGQTANE